MEEWSTHQAHDLKTTGSNPVPALREDGFVEGRLSLTLNLPSSLVL